MCIYIYIYIHRYTSRSDRIYPWSELCNYDDRRKTKAMVMRTGHGTHGVQANIRDDMIYVITYTIIYNDIYYTIMYDEHIHAPRDADRVRHASARPRPPALAIYHTYAGNKYYQQKAAIILLSCYYDTIKLPVSYSYLYSALSLAAPARAGPRGILAEISWV